VRAHAFFRAGAVRISHLHFGCHLLSTRAKPANVSQVTLSAKGSVGSLEVILPRSHLRQCRAHEPSIAFRYPYKFMKSALSGVAGRVDVSSEISIDANGMFRVRIHIRRVCVSSNVDAVRQECGGRLPLAMHGSIRW
jgi:hypothetical protein